MKKEWIILQLIMYRTALQNFICGIVSPSQQVFDLEIGYIILYHFHLYHHQEIQNHIFVKYLSKVAQLFRIRLLPRGGAT